MIREWAKYAFSRGSLAIGVADVDVGAYPLDQPFEPFHLTRQHRNLGRLYSLERLYLFRVVELVSFVSGHRLYPAFALRLWLGFSLRMACLR